LVGVFEFVGFEGEVADRDDEQIVDASDGEDPELGSEALELTLARGRPVVRLMRLR
jgi:hypothetical protein